MRYILTFIILLALSCAAFGQTSWQMSHGTATIDADLSDWAEVQWVNVDIVAYGSPVNLSNAKMAVKWDTHNIYMAVQYDDAVHRFSDGELGWDQQDSISAYVNANNDNASPYNPEFITAQDWVIGVKGDNPSGLSSTPASSTGWYNLGSNNPLPDPINWPYAVIDVATNVTGDTITYEMRLPALNDITTGSLETLSAGKTVGVDVLIGDMGESQYEGQLAIDRLYSNWTNASHLQDWTLVNEVTAAHYKVQETSPGTWEVSVDVDGDNTAGLVGYELWVDGVDPSQVSFTQNTLADGIAGFQAGTVVQGAAGGSFNFGNYQGTDSEAILGVGMTNVLVGGVDLDEEALLGILTTPEGLGEENFRATLAGLLNLAGDGYLNTDDLVATLEVIPLVLLPGDANRDGVVSAGDYASVRSHFGETGAAGILGDANGDGVVSADDYASVQANFGNVAGVSGVGVIPEPATLSFMGLSFVTLIRRRWKVKSC